MRPIVFVALVLSALTVVWCAIHYVGAEPQLIETQAELRKAQATGLSDSAIDVHVARAQKWRRHWGVATLLAAGATFMIFIPLVIRRGDGGDRHI